MSATESPLAARRAALEPLKNARLPVIDERLPFPASGQQREFLAGFARALAASGF